MYNITLTRVGCDVVFVGKERGCEEGGVWGRGLVRWLVWRGRGQERGQKGKGKGHWRAVCEAYDCGGEGEIV